MDFIASGLKKVGITRQIFGAQQSVIKPLTNGQKEKWSKAYAEDQSKLKDYFAPPPKTLQR